MSRQLFVTAESIVCSSRVDVFQLKIANVFFSQLTEEKKILMVLFCFRFSHVIGGPAVRVILQTILRVHRSVAPNEGRKDTV